MSMRDEAAKNLFERGQYVELLRNFSDVTAQPSGAPVPTRLVLAHAMAITGELAGAKRLATGILGERLPAENHARAHLALGIARERAGQVEDALTEYKKGLALIDEDEHPVLAAWIRLYQLRLFVEGHSMKALTSMIAGLRRLVIRTGESQQTAYLHMCIAVLEGETGHLDEGTRHAELAESLLQLSDNSSLRSANLLNKGCLDVLKGNLKDAAKAFHLAKSLTRQTGDPFIASRADGNLAHMHLLAGDLEQARTLFKKTIGDGTFGKLGEVGVLDGLARVYLTEGDFDSCIECLERIESYKADFDAPPSMYHVRWAGLTKVRLLIRQRKWIEADSLLASLKHDAEGIRDTPFEIALALSSALVAIQRGDQARASGSLLVADRLGGVRSLDLQPQLYHIASTIVGASAPSLRDTLRLRAARLWDAQGVVSMRVELDDAGTSLDAARRELKLARTTSPTAARTMETLTNTIAAVFDLAHSPRLAGGELLSVIEALDCSPKARVVAGLSQENTEDHVIRLGTQDGKTISLMCQAEPT